MPKATNSAVVNVEQAQKSAFLAAFAETGTITQAARAAEISRTTHYNWLADADYARAFDEAGKEAADRLEAEAVRRAVEGVQEPVYYKGEVVGHVLKYSDPLLIFMLKGAKPEKYMDAGVVNVHQVNRSIAVTSLSADELRELAAGLRGNART